ncbi:MAG TPA: murein biosynthesis integral membrane protein MurJ [Candidatus Saccharimonadales bacterium]|nr:murein biosynthesis integral membrane protein MurJ [Candidatus Saccharimonadales bacterium]
MNRLLNRANSRISLSNAAALLMATAFIGQLLGFMRTKLVNANFPATGPQSTDAFFAAFKIPDFFYFTLAAGALGVAFMPFLADKLAKGDKKSVWELSNSLLNLLSIVMLAVGLIIVIFAKPLISHVVAPNMTPQQLDNATTIMRFIAFNPLLFMISAIFMSVQQAMGRFFFYAFAPLLYNTSIIVSVFVFKDNLGITGLGIGALVGILLQVLVSTFGFVGLRYKYKFRINWKNSEFRQILKQLPPRSADQGIDSLNSIVETNFANQLGQGKLTFYENANILQTAPTLLIGTTISTAAFPRLNDRLAQGRKDLFRKDFLKILRVIIWITLPVVVIAYFCRGYLARLIFSRDAPEIALIFGFFFGAIFFRTIYTLISRWFYAQKDTKTPLLVSIFAILLNIFLAYTLSRPSAYDIAGLAIAQSVVAAAEVLILVAVMVVRDRKLIDSFFWDGIFRMLSTTGFTVIAAYAMLSIFPLAASDKGFIQLGTKLVSISAVILLVHFVTSLMFGIDEAKAAAKWLKNFVMSPIRIQ